MVSWLKSMGVAIGVATNSIRKTSETMLEFAGLLKFIDVLVTNEDVEFAKPAPDIYKSTARRLGQEPGNILVVEDHEFGVAAALAAGCRVLKVDGVDEVTTSLLQPEFSSTEGD